MAVSKVWASPHIGTASSPRHRDEAPMDVPIITGSAGLVGRPSVRPVNVELVQPIGQDEYGEPIYAQPPASSLAIPSSCLRVLSSPRPECPAGCEGLMRDGCCLAETVRDNPGAELQIDIDGYWQLKD